MSDFAQYRRSQIAELRPYVDGEELSDRVSISAPDREAGSPKPGDMIARNPKNHDDQWLVAAKYFADNFEQIAIAPMLAAQPAEDRLAAVASIANEMHTVAHSLCEPTRKAVDVWAHDILEQCSKVDESTAECAARADEPMERWVRAAISWVLYHHQGGNSAVGQPLRFALGLGAHETLPDWCISEAKKWAIQAGAQTKDFHAVAQTGVPKWQPIETAPKNGHEIFLGSPGCVYAGFWQSEHNYWGESGWYASDEREQSWYSSHPDKFVTHWMPLPVPPLAAAPTPSQKEAGA